MKGYWNRPDATAEAIVDGWFHTGDVGVQDEDGYFYVVDRKKDMIISGGENIYPAEVEDCLYQHPGIAEVAVIGIPDPRWGELVRAVVVPRPGTPLQESEIIEFTQGRLARYKQPRSVVFTTTPSITWRKPASYTWPTGCSTTSRSTSPLRTATCCRYLTPSSSTISP